MKTLHTAYRVRHLERSLEFYEKIGFREIGRVTIEDGSILVMLNLDGDGDVVTLELVSNNAIGAVEIGNGFSHIAVQVGDIESTLAEFDRAGISYDGPHLPGGEDGPKTCFVHDPDGYRIELVQWPAGHSDSMTRADFG
jgi:lactoylglutathione lyase